MAVGARTGDGAADARVGRGIDLVGVELEVGDVSGALSDGEGVAEACADDLSVLGPVDEGVALVFGGGQCAGVEMAVGSRTGDGAADARVGRGSDLVAVDLEVGHVSCSFCDGEGEGVRCTHDLTVLGPVGEGVARICGGGQGAACTVVVGSSACDGATRVRVSRSSDLVAVDLEVGDVSGSFCDGEGEGVRCTHDLTVLGPVDESVT